MTTDILVRLSAAIRGQVLVNEPLTGHTSLKVGGPADYFAIPADGADLEELLRVVRDQSLPYLVLGGGFNVLMGDGGFRGAVISLQRLTGLEIDSHGRIRVEAGVLNQQLVTFATERSLTGLEFLSCIPGTVGGALSVNAGAHGQSVMEQVAILETLKDGGISESEGRSRHFGYRYLELDPGEIVVAATFALGEGKAEAIREKLEACSRHRQESQRIGFPNAGSFFKNPEGGQAWRLIDEAGFRGRQVGGAQVSEVHTNFLVNRGGATATDFITLAGMIKQAVFEQSGILLQEEVRILGEFEQR
ncbi:UDP-N-acetylmuramate dehydrogenase [Geotalea sp. SG265]|uniref:UDP-N-acetylmuramate dehydrogenase n=1 Tax=Geotalea sp. SG265 TaxID=2922867 RepID=UPI001FAFEB69|nr:UDP-N-acetylmuramate dehydrogenase [Geotalea sp. SG265]